MTDITIIVENAGETAISGLIPTVSGGTGNTIQFTVNEEIYDWLDGTLSPWTSYGYVMVGEPGEEDEEPPAA